MRIRLFLLVLSKNCFIFTFFTVVIPKAVVDELINDSDGYEIQVISDEQISQT